VGDENSSDISDVDTSLRNTARDAVASVNDSPVFSITRSQSI